MFYCEKCRLLNNDTICKNCGKSHLSTAQTKDICFVVRLWLMYASMYEEALKNQNIPVFSIPCGFSLNTRASDGKNIYVPYEFYDKAVEIYEDIFFGDDEHEGSENQEQACYADVGTKTDECDDN